MSSSSDGDLEKASAQQLQGEAATQHSPSSVNIISSEDSSSQPYQASSRNSPSNLSAGGASGLADSENIASTSRKASHKEKEKRASRSSRHRDV